MRENVNDLRSFTVELSPDSDISVGNLEQRINAVVCNSCILENLENIKFLRKFGGKSCYIEFIIKIRMKKSHRNCLQK